MAKSPTPVLELHHNQRAAESAAYQAISQLLNNPNTDSDTKLEAMSILSNLLAISKAHPTP